MPFTTPWAMASATPLMALSDPLTGVSQGNGLRVEFPIVKDPGGTVMGFLLGQESDLVKVTADYKVDIDKTFNLSPVPGIIIGFSGQGSFVAHAGLGYDTVGLRDAIALLYNGGGFDPSKFFDGLWIDTQTRLSGNGKVDVTGGIGIPEASLTANGGLTANLLPSRCRPILLTPTSCGRWPATWATRCSTSADRWTPTPSYD